MLQETEISSKRLYTDVLRIAWPAMVDVFLNQLTSMVDLVMVGRLGSWTIAAVGLTVQPKFILMSVFMALNVGTTAMVARFKGMGEQENARKALRQALLLNLGLCLALSAIGFALARPMVAAMGADSPETLDGGTTYLRVQMLGFVFLGITTAVTAALRGAGQTRVAMGYNIAANVLNAITCYGMVEGRLGFPRWEIFGASFSTVLGQMLACGLAIGTLIRGKHYVYLLKGDSFRPDRDLLRRLFRIGLPAMLEQGIMRAGLLIFTLMVSRLGTFSLAVHQACLSIHGFSFMGSEALSVAAASLMGQNLGKNRPDMASQYTTRARRLGQAVAIIMGVIFLFFGRSLIGLFTTEQDVIEAGMSVLRVAAFILPFQSSQIIIAGSLRGAGDTKATSLITMLGILIIRPPLAFIFVYTLGFGVHGAWIGMLMDQGLRSGLTWLRFRSGKWKTLRI